MEIRIYPRKDGTKSILFRNKENGRIKLLEVPANQKPDLAKVREAVDFVRSPTSLRSQV